MKLNAIQSLYNKACHQDEKGNVFINGKKPTAIESKDIDKEVLRLTLIQDKSEKVKSISKEYQTLLDAGVTYNGTLFQSDAKSVQTLSETLTAIANGWALPVGFAWIDAANTPHPASVAFLKGLSAALADHKTALFTRLQVAKQAIKTATSKAAIDAVIL
ncbi:MAG: DUF4376 domain-containing protein [Mariprofundaceae bacterium]|nr:DUF4376 domain-containing protein [Mariprofundaceae bacterium]